MKKIPTARLATAVVVCFVLGAAGLAQAQTQAAVQAPKAGDLGPDPQMGKSKSSLLPAPTPAAQDAIGANDLSAANSLYAQALASRNKGDMQGACQQATNAAAALSQLPSKTHANTTKMFEGLKTKMCSSSPSA